jgi:hypothetical protein
MSIISWTSPHQLRRGFADGYQPAKIIFRRAQFLGEQLYQFAVGVRDSAPFWKGQWRSLILPITSPVIGTSVRG